MTSPSIPITFPSLITPPPIGERSIAMSVSVCLCLSVRNHTDDVIGLFAHKPRLLDVAAQLKRSAHAALGLASVRSNTTAGQRTHRNIFRALKVTAQMATAGAESAVYHCLVTEYQVKL